MIPLIGLFSSADILKPDRIQNHRPCGEWVGAVQKVDQLRPDVILMDINLPGIDGIEATRQICNTCPGSKIVFVSMFDDSAIVQAAFDVGGSGYILKHDFAQDLFPGIRAVLDGRQFVSRSLPRR
jgi:DNA-binding NarL/FixJ family response regulator